MPPMSQGWTVVCDFDGTISTIDVTDFLLEAYADPVWLAIEVEWKSGEIGSWECLSRQLAVLRANRSDIDALVDTVHIDPYFKEFAEFCASSAVPLVIVSDGLDEVIVRILRRHGLGHLPVYANSLLTVGVDQHRLLSPFRNADCCTKAGTCKCEVVADLVAQRPDRILFVGDGQSDFCAAARMADTVAAKSKLLAQLKATHRSCEEFVTFADVRQLLAELLSRHAPQSERRPETLHEHN